MPRNLILSTRLTAIFIFYIVLFTSFNFIASKSQNKSKLKEEESQNTTNLEDKKSTPAVSKKNPSSDKAAKNVSVSSNKTLTAETKSGRPQVGKLEDSSAINPARHIALEMMKRLIHEDSQSGNKPNYIKKTVFDDSKRILFFAGLEGTGHHAMKEVMMECVNTTFCTSFEDMNLDLFKRNSNGVFGLFGAADAAKSSYWLDSFLEHLTVFSQLSQPQLSVLALGMIPRVGMASYPNFGSTETKSIDHPDLLPLVVLAEAAKVDLRIVVLQRKAYDILVSTIVHRNFGHGYEARILLDNAAVLYSQLKLIDPKFFVCLHYHNMHNLTNVELSHMRNFLHPKIDDKLMTKMWKHIQYHEHAEDPAERQKMKPYEYSALRLEIELNRIDSLCPPL
jgi:hypothetical protein